MKKVKQARLDLGARGYLESPDGIWTSVQSGQVTYARIKESGEIERYWDTYSFEGYGGRKNEKRS